MTRHRRRSVIKSIGAAGAIGLSGLSGCQGVTGGGGGIPTVNFNYVVPIENAASLMAVPKIQDQLEHLGSDYEFNVTQDSSTPDSLNQMAAGDSDIVMTSTVSFASAVNQNAVSDGISIIGVDFWDAHPDYYSVSVFSGPNSNITKPADLKGKTLGVNALGTGIHSVYVKALRQAGLTRDDVEFVETPFPTFTSSVKQGKIDTGVYPALFAVGARAEGFTKVFDSSQLWNQYYPFTYATASQSSLDEKSEAMSMWGRDYVSLFEYVRNNRKSVVSAASSHFDLPKSTIDAFYFTKKNGYYRNIRIDMNALQYIMDDLKNLGFIDSSFDVGKHATNEYLPNSQG